MNEVRALQVDSVVAGYLPDLPIIHGVSIHVNKGEIVAIIGPNGAGKSTLIKAIAGLVRMSSGSISMDGRDITGVAAHQLAAEGVGLVPQTGNVFATLTIHENLVMGSAPLTKALARQRIDEIYSMYPVLAERRREKAGILSGGQRQILALARALLTKPSLMLLDEPTAGLSPMAAKEFFEVVQGLVRGGASVLMVEQNAKAALRISGRGYVLAEGQNRLDGPSSELLSSKEVGMIFLGVRPGEDALRGSQ